MTIREVSTPEQAHGLHTEFVEYRQAHPNQDRNLHAGYWRAVALSAGDDAQALLDLTDENHIASRICDDVAITRADTVFLTDDLRELVRTAEATMPDSVLFPTDLFTPCGFVVLETPITHTVKVRVSATDYERISTDLVSAFTSQGVPVSVSGESRHSSPDSDGAHTGTETYAVRALMWADSRAVAPDADVRIKSEFGADSIGAQVFGSTALPEDGGVFVRVYGHLVSMEVDGVTVSFGDVMPLQLVSRHAHLYGENASEFHSALADDSEHLLPQSASEARKSSEENNEFVCRFTVALLRLMDEYVDVERTRITRAYGRRAERSGRTGEVRDVVVLSLRRALYEGDGDATGRKVTLAHLVRGHWRNQWYPSQQAHRAKWIRAHRRGGAPTDEVVERPRIIAVDR